MTKFLITMLIIVIVVVGGLVIYFLPDDTAGNSINTEDLPDQDISSQIPDDDPGSEASQETSAAQTPEAAPPETPATGNTTPDPTDTTDPDQAPEITTQGESADVTDKRNIMLMHAEELYLAGKYNEALALIREDETLFNEDTRRLENEILKMIGN